LWKRYIQFAETEWAFRITKDELQIRPICIKGRSVFSRISWSASWRLYPPLRERLFQGRLIKGFILFVKHEKTYWMVPLIVVLLIVGALIVFTSPPPLAPFLYPLF